MPDVLMEVPPGLVQVELRLTSDMPLRVAPRHEVLGDVFLAVVPEGPAFRAERSWRHIARDPQETLSLAFIDAGQMRLRQGGREIFLEAGDLVLLDTTRPYQIVSRDMFATRNFQFPKALLGLADTDVSHLTGTQLRQGHALSAFLVPYLGRLAQPNVSLHPVTRDRLVHDVTDILSTLIGETMREMPLEDAARRTFVLRAKAFIDAHLDDPDLDPERIALAHGISVRYLHKLFQADGITVGRWILHARLEKCRRVLAEADYPDVTVSDVCHSWGFVSPAHFSRAFRTAYAMSPKQWQILARARRRR